jgi:hypothetical protein
MREAGKLREKQIIQSYVWVLRAPKNTQGVRTSALARHGVFEVRLIEPSDMARGDVQPFWIELYDHDNRTTVDSHGGADIEEAAEAAVTLIARAIILHAAKIS